MAANPDCDSSENDPNMVREIVKNIMVLDHNKKPFKYCDIVSSLNPKPARKRWPQMFADAKEYLKFLGYNIHETKVSNNKVFFVTSQIQPLHLVYNYAHENEISDRILLTFVLTYIFMKNGVVYSDRLFSHLQSLGMYNQSEKLHCYFGNVKKKILTEFAEQLYLSLVKVSADPELFEIKWGQRAELEISKRSVLEFICQQGFKGKVKPHEHTSHYEQVLIQEEQAYLPDDANADEQAVVGEVADEAVDDSDSDCDMLEAFL